MSNREHPEDGDALLGANLIKQLEFLTNSLGLAGNPTSKKLLRDAILDPGNFETTRETAELILQQAAARSLKKRSDLNPADPSFLLGPDEAGNPTFLQLNTLTKHLLIPGSTGSGKTIALCHIAIGVSEAARQAGLPVRIFGCDFKDDLRRLARRLPVIVIPWGHLKLNLLRPPLGVPLKHWVLFLLDLIDQLLFHLHPASRNLLANILHGLYEQFDSENSNIFPSVVDLTEKLKELSLAEETNPGERSKVLTLRNHFDGLRARIGTSIDYRVGMPFERLIEAEEGVIFEFSGLDGELAVFLVSALLGALYLSNLAHSRRGGVIRHLVLLDECGNIL